MENEKEISRRAVLCGLAVLALGFVPETALAATGLRVLADGRTEITLAKNKSLAKVGGVIEFTDLNGNSIALIRSGKGAKAYRALNLSCTHEGTVVRRSGSKWVCPNHRAEFSLQGKVESGPALLPLSSLPIKVTKKKIVVG